VRRRWPAWSQRPANTARRSTCSAAAMRCVSRWHTERAPTG